MNKIALPLLLVLLMAVNMLGAVETEEDSCAIPVTSVRPEIRALWALPWDINTPEKVMKLVETATNSHQNELLVEVRYRADALFDTARGAEQYPNPEPRSPVLEIPDYDPLQDILEKAHAAGIKVHAWVIVFNATTLDKTLLATNYIYQNHRDWITWDASGKMMRTSSQYGYYIDPGIPEVQDYVLKTIGNLVAGYPDLDGIQLDYIRYPNASLGYHPVSVARYQEYCRIQGEISFNAWRIMQVTEFVQRFQNLVKQINPQIITSAAVFADIADANLDYAQDWPTWLREGYIDRVYPMAYSTKITTFKRQLEQFRLLGKPEAIVVGIRAWRDDNGSLLKTSGYNLGDVVQRIEEVRAHELAGIALFSYSGIKPYSAWEPLTQMAYPTAVPYVQTSSLIKTAQPELSLVPRVYNHGYLLKLWLPEEGWWSWVIRDNELTYHHQNFYQQGDNQEFWDGLIADEQGNALTQIKPGDYVLELYKDEGQFQYLIPVTFTATEQP